MKAEKKIKMMFSPPKIEQGEMTSGEHAYASQSAALDRNIALYFELVGHRRDVVQAILDEFDRRRELGTFLRDELSLGYPVMKLLHTISMVSLYQSGQVLNNLARLQSLKEAVSVNENGVYAGIIDRILARIQ